MFLPESLRLFGREVADVVAYDVLDAAQRWQDVLAQDIEELPVSAEQTLAAVAVGGGERRTDAGDCRVVGYRRMPII